MDLETHVVIFILILQHFASSATTNKLFGLYNIKYEYIHLCKGSRGSINGTESFIKLDVVENRQVLTGNVTMFQEDGPLEYSLKMWRWDGKKYVLTMNLDLRNACSLKKLRDAVFSLFVKFKDNTCIVEKGTVQLNNIDGQKIATDLYMKIIYGKYKVHFDFSTPSFNTICLNVVADFVPV